MRSAIGIRSVAFGSAVVKVVSQLPVQRNVAAGALHPRQDIGGVRIVVCEHRAAFHRPERLGRELLH